MFHPGWEGTWGKAVAPQAQKLPLLPARLQWPEDRSVDLRVSGPVCALFMPWAPSGGLTGTQSHILLPLPACLGE